MLRSRKNNEPKKVSGFGEPETFKSKYKIVAWIKNYWYYYKIPIIIGGCVLILAVWLIVDIATKEEYDLRLHCVADLPLMEEHYDAMAEAITPYVTDVDGDKKVLINATYLNLAKDPQDEMQVYAFQQIITVFYDETISLMLVDDFAYEYMQQSDGFAKLADYGVTGGLDEYRIPANHTFVMKDNTAANHGDFYLVLRVCPQDMENKKGVAERYEIAVNILRDAAADYQAYLQTESAAD